MPAKKKSVKKAPKENATRKSNHNHGGTYLTPKGNVSIAVPPFWFFRQTNDDLELDSPTTATSIVVSAFQRTGRVDAARLPRFDGTLPRHRARCRP